MTRPIHFLVKLAICMLLAILWLSYAPDLAMYLLKYHPMYQVLFVFAGYSIMIVIFTIVLVSEFCRNRA